MEVQTATGTLELTDGLPDWVVANLIEQAGGAAAPSAGATGGAAGDGGDVPSVNANPTEGPGMYVIAADGTPVWIDPAMPSWVIASLLEPHGGLAPGAPVIPVPPVAPVVTPPAGAPGGGATSFPVPVPLPPPPVGPLPPPPSGPSIVNTVTGAVGSIVNTVTDIAAKIRDGAAAVLGPVGNVLGSALDTVLGATRSIINQLVPTVSELALGLTSKFSDLASFIGGNLADLGDFAGAFAGGMYEALTGAFADAWSWLFRALLAFLRGIGNPASELTRGLQLRARMVEL